MSKGKNGKEVIAQGGVQDGEIVVSLQDEIPKMTTDAEVTLHLADRIKEKKEDLKNTPE